LFMYGVIAIFDESTDRAIRDIWQGLSDNSISYYAGEVIDRVPHITLASYETLDEKSFKLKMNEVYKEQKSIDLTFNSLGSFLNSGTLYLSPVMTKDLDALHFHHHRAFEEFSEHASPFYLPERWTPHCTLANRLSSGKLALAFTYCSDISALIGKINKIGLIKVQGNSAPVIHTLNLK
jgi:2'-5' RNA ligase